ncbi:MAG: 30S ribosome-binding factor RbfA [Flavobacteriales bacterium]|nr:30S ribosome-binding factor RbfA [Flavobacteriales bacterium]MCX7768813.1 30S ribosome-binding factor RbfA [Flavobacteriales bacterium]MDW8410413.1 30S ribosome-binding factor RbfA [Flavobacteriales bacterium]
MALNSSQKAKYERLVLRELSAVLPSQFQWTTPGALITVTDVRLSPDLSIARIQLSVYPLEYRSTVLNHCEENKGAIRFALGQRLRSKMRRVPELYFYIDEFYDKLERINQLLKK